MYRSLLRAVSVAALGLSCIPFAQAVAADGLKLPPGVPISGIGYAAAGTDYLTTDTASSFDFTAPGIIPLLTGEAAALNPGNPSLVSDLMTDIPTWGTSGVVNFQGTAVPGFGGADSIIQRPYDTPINAGAAPMTNPTVPTGAPTACAGVSCGELAILGVNLASTSQVTIGSKTYGLTARLAPTPPASVTVTGTGPGTPNPTVTVTPDTGTIAIYGNQAGGTFASSFNVYLDLIADQVIPGEGYVPADAIDLGTIDLVLGQTGATWGSGETMNGLFNRTAADDGSLCSIYALTACDVTASVHTGLANNVVDFFPGAQVDEEHEFGGTLAEHRVFVAPETPPNPTPDWTDPPSTPEPSTWFLMLLGLGAVGWIARRRASERIKEGGQARFQP